MVGRCKEQEANLGFWGVKEPPKPGGGEQLHGAVPDLAGHSTKGSCHP